MAFRVIKNIFFLIKNLIFEPLVNFITSFAPGILEVLAIFILGWSWNSLFAIISIFLLCGCVLLLISYLAAGKTIADLFRFLTSYDLSTFKNVKKEAYFQLFENNNEGNTTIKKSYFFKTLAQREKGINIYTIFEEDQNSLIPQQIITFPSILGSWIFLPFEPSQMQGIDKFKLLHEFGHISLYSFSRVMHEYSIGVFIYIFSVSIVALRVEFNIYTVSILWMIFFLSWIYKYWEYKNVQGSITADEISADYFALTHSNIKWFKDYPAETLAQRLCFTKNVSQEYISMREHAFVSILTSIREGEEPERLEMYLPNRIHNKKLVTTKFFIAILFLPCFFWYRPISTVEMVYVSTALLILLSAISSTVRLSSYADFLTKITTEGDDFPIKAFNRLRSNQKKLHQLIKRLPALQSLLQMPYLAVCQLVEIGYRRRDGEKSNHPIKVFSTITNQNVLHIEHPNSLNVYLQSLPILFLPDELDIYAKKITNEVFIFHGKTIDYGIDHVEYHEHENWLTIHYFDGRVFNLGVQVQWSIRPYFEDAENISIVRTENGKEMENVSVPLIKAKKSLTN